MFFMEDKLKILIIDDDVVDRMAVRRALKVAGESVDLFEAQDSREAIETLNQHNFDCIFLDYRLPDTDGLTLLQQLRSRSVKIPIVVLTGQGDEQIAVEMMKAGASDYISKAKVSAESLSRSLRNAIRIYRAEQEAALAQQQLKISEERYRLVLEGSKDAIWDWDIQKNEIYWNNRLTEIIGFSSSEFGLEGCNIARTWEAFSQLLHPEDIDKLRRSLIEHLCGNGEFNLEFRLRHKSGEYRCCMTRGKAQRDGRGRAIRMAGIISDITAVKLAQEELHRRFEQLQIIYQITETVSRAAGLEEIYQIALNGLQRALKADRVSILLYDPDGVLRFKAWCGLSQEYRQCLEGHSPWSCDTINPPPICISDVEIEPSLEECRTAIVNEGIRALAFIPLVTPEKLMGKFMLYYDRVHHFTEEEIQIAQTVASSIAFAAERKQAEEALHRRQEEFKALVENAPDIIARFARELRLLYVNPALEKATGILTTAIIGKNLLDFNLSTNTKMLWQESLDRVFLNGKEEEIEFDLPASDGRVRYYQARLVPEFARDGSTEQVLTVSRDITERKQAEDSQRFLADASTILSVSLDYEITWSNLAHLIVPQIADWCIIHVFDRSDADLTKMSLQDASNLRPVAFSHANSSKKAFFQEWQRCYPDKTTAWFGVERVLQTGQSEFYPEITEEILAANVRDTEQLEILHQLAPKSAICVPLVARGRTLGAIALGTSESDRQYDRADLVLAEDLARRAALAVDNARLYRESQEASENLRRAIIILGEQQQQLRTLQRLTNLLNQRLANLPDLLQVMVQSVCDAIYGAQFCSIVLQNPECNGLVLTVTAGIGTENLRLDDICLDGESWLNQAVSTGEFQLFQKINTEKSAVPAIPNSGDNEDEEDVQFLQPAAVYAVPISSAQAGRLGILAIGNWEDPHAFDPEDRHLLVAVGEQAAIAINNARLIKTLEEREERLAFQNEMLADQNRELENQRQQIQLQNLQLLEAAKLKSQFLATVSHELRTPMNAIIGFSQLLLRQVRMDDRLKSAIAPEQENMIERILNNGKHLLKLINDILDLSKIEAGRLELEREELNLANLVRSTVEEMRFLTDEKSLNLQYFNNLNDPLIVNDSGRLRQILLNLLSNAIKFTNEGSVQIEASELPDDRIAIAVRDTGIGIAEEHLEHIFEEFRQVDQSTTKSHYGTGLGLAIIRSLVQLMKGTINVTSKLGEGSIFTVEIPRNLPSSNQKKAKTPRRLLK